MKFFIALSLIAAANPALASKATTAARLAKQAAQYPHLVGSHVELLSQMLTQQRQSQEVAKLSLHEIEPGTGRFLYREDGSEGQITFDLMRFKERLALEKKHFEDEYDIASVPLSRHAGQNPSVASRLRQKYNDLAALEELVNGRKIKDNESAQDRYQLAVEIVRLMNSLSSLSVDSKILDSDLKGVTDFKATIALRKSNKQKT